eukprot:TRINITY_DN8998_c0_g1_i2.p1 TRINITY_DN8998_c0_g1~~TRINITY_DN8998_c0_g1_i2.p1  ORF type:complete len:157 (+),score=24.82 TRINITY_DN8998_c0_g1_i2:83-553(+)
MSYGSGWGSPPTAPCGWGSPPTAASPGRGPVLSPKHADVEAEIEEVRVKLSRMGWNGGRVAGGHCTVVRAPLSPGPSSPYRRRPPREQPDVGGLAQMLSRCVLSHPSRVRGAGLALLTDCAAAQPKQYAGLAALRSAAGPAGPEDAPMSCGQGYHL